jgi:hypothetical protein
MMKMMKMKSFVYLLFGRRRYHWDCLGQRARLVGA